MAPVLGVVARAVHSLRAEGKRKTGVSDAAIQNGATVRFRLRDVICPEVGEVAGQITPDLEVTGEVALISEGRGPEGGFAIVHVAGIQAPIIVPVSVLRVPQSHDWLDRLAG